MVPLRIGGAINLQICESSKRGFYLDWSGDLMRFFRDGNGSLCVEWEQGFGHRKRAWIQRKGDSEKDWAKTPERRYLNVVRVDSGSGNPSGNATDFPVFCNLPDRQILEAFVTFTAEITGLVLGTQQEN